MSNSASVLSSWSDWREWQTAVVAAVREEFRDLFHSMHVDDFDWEAWRPYFNEGQTPLAAVQQALSTQVGLRPAHPSAYEAISAMRIEVD